MKKLNKWLFEIDMDKSQKYIFWLFIIMSIYNAWACYDHYQSKAYLSAILSAGSFGILFCSVFYYGLIYLMRKSSLAADKRNTVLIIENFELKQKILILKIPHLVKTIQDDKLSS